MAGLAGALFAGLRQTISATDFQLLSSLPLLLIAVVFGVTSVTGAAIGGVCYTMLPVLQSNYPRLAGLAFAVIGFGAVALGRDPNGLANALFGIGRKVQAALGPAVADRIPSLRPLPLAGLLGRDGGEEESAGRHRHDDGYAWSDGAGSMGDTQVVSTEEVAGHGVARG